MRVRATVRTPAGDTDVLVTGDGQVPVGAVRAAMGLPDTWGLRSARRAVHDDEALGDGGIRAGDILESGGGSEPDGRTFASVYELVVVSGPAAGRRARFDRAALSVGRDAGCDVVLDDALVSARHAQIAWSGTRFELTDLGSANGTSVEDEPVAGTVGLAPGAAVRIGSSVVTVSAPIAADADVHDDGEGGLAFNRQARLRPPESTVEITVPAEVRDADPWPFPWATVLAPLVFAIGALVIFRRPEMLLFAVMSPVLAVSATMTTRKRDRRRREREQERFDRMTEIAIARSAETVVEQRAARRAQFLSPPEAVETATGPSSRVWERRHHDTDAFELRVGLGPAPAEITFALQSSEATPPEPRLAAVPQTVRLRDVGVLGVAGTTERTRAVGRWLVAQLATWHAPADLSLVVLCDEQAESDWTWVRWLPHTHADDPAAPLCWLGNDRPTRADRVRELLKILEARKEAADGQHGVEFLPAVVMVVDGARPLRAIAGMTRLLREGPRYGIFTVALDDDRTRLPEEAHAELILDGGEPGLGDLYVDLVAPRPQLVVDTLSVGDAERLARGLCPLRATGGDEDLVIPTSVRFVDLASIDLDDVESVRARWALAGRSTDALVGVSIDGPFAIDLNHDGPHGLVAGTTGAGKSEFLQTLVSSLAFVNRPDALNFVLVDYKGASAFADCERLPHTVGLVSNLDGHLTERALVSLDAELQRRERLLHRLGAPDVDTAWERDPHGAADHGLARLVIVVDEFAELVHELPDFITGLIRIARVGRSLGVHLILATQRPAGVVSAEMRANTGLRVALRMEDRSDSTEVIDSPVASTISRSTPGRAFVRTGGGGALVGFQAARVAGRRPGVAADVIPAPEVLPFTWRRLGHPLPRHRPIESTDERATDLHALVALITDAATRDGVVARHRPWLPPLPELILFDQLVQPASAGPVRSVGSAGSVGPVAVGVEDHPASQSQAPYTYDVAGDGHVAVIGSARAGRSSALRAFAGALVSRHDPRDLHVYGLDFGNGALRPLAELPHCGAVVTGTETDRIERLAARLVAELGRRQDLFADVGYGDLAEQRADRPDQALPYVVVLLDRFESMLATFPPDSPSDVPATLTRLLREGPSVGFRVIVSGDRALLSHRDAAHIATKLVMGLADRNDYRLADINPRTVADTVAPGRAMRPDTRSEIQFALLDADPSGPAQGAALRALGERWPQPDEARQPIHVDAIPRRLTPADLAALPSRTDAGSWWLPIGAGGDRLTQIGVDLAKAAPGIVIGGPRRSGRTNALAHVAIEAAARGHAVIWLAPRDPDTAAAAAAAGAVVLAGTDAKDASELQRAIASCESPPLLCIDDADGFARTEADDWLAGLGNNGTAPVAAIVAAGDTTGLDSELRGTIPQIKRGGLGVVLTPSSPMEGSLLGVRFDRTQLGGTAGRGLLKDADGTLTVVQIPVVAP